MYIFIPAIQYRCAFVALTDLHCRGLSSDSERTEITSTGGAGMLMNAASGAAHYRALKPVQKVVT